MNSDNSAFAKPLRVLIVEDSEDDTLLLLRELLKVGYLPVHERVETPEAMMAALAKQQWDIVISDYVLPKFSGLAALAVLRRSGQDLPFIIVSGNIGEVIAVGAMKAGAHDYIIKGNLARLVPAVERELREAEVRKERKKAEEALSLFKNLLNQSSDCIFVVDPETAGLLEINDSACTNLGYSREELLTMRVIDFAETQQDLSTWRAYAEKIKEKGNIVLEDRLMRKDRTVFPVEVSVRHISHKEKDYHVAVVRDITERRETESRIMLSNAFLKLFSQTVSSKEYLDSVVKLIKEWTGCRCVGIRILDDRRILGDSRNIPYESYTGFSKDFWKKENFLSVDHDQCICARVIAGCPEPSDLACMTPGGSFISGNTTSFTEALSNEQRSKYRGACIQAGFRSLAVVPIRYLDRTLGAIHMADEREGVTTLKKLEFLEQLAVIAGEAIYRFSADEELRKSREELRNLGKHMQEAREKERTTIAREIHDELGQIITALRLELAWIRDRYKDHKVIYDKSTSMLAMVDATIQTIQNIITELRPGILDVLGLFAAIEWQAEEVKKMSGITCDLELPSEDVQLSTDISTNIFRIIQELFTNIVRYSRATNVSVQIEIKGDRLFLEVKDDGIGIRQRDISSPVSFGIIGIRERIYAMKGEMHISGTHGIGTSVTIVLPVHTGQNAQSV